MSTLRVDDKKETILMSQTFSSSELILNPINAEYIIRYAQTTKNIHLTEKQQADITNAFIHSRSLKKLSDLATLFNQAKSMLDALIGLTNQQQEEIKTLRADIKQFEKIPKEQLNTTAYRTLFKKEKRLIELDRLLKWWTLNISSLQKSAVWNDIAAWIKLENKNENELLIKHKIEKLLLLKTEWVNQIHFAASGSDMLLFFYDHYICAFEACIKDELNKKLTYPDGIRDYLKNTLSELMLFKKQMITAMLLRLKCAEFYNNLQCDDILFYMTDQITKNCGVRILRPEEMPEKRLGLSLKLIAQFVTAIDKYITENNHDIDVMTEFKKLKMNSTPDSWKLKNNLIHPIITYLANTFPETLDLLLHHDYLANQIIGSDNSHNDEFLINKIQYFMHASKQQYELALKNKIIDKKHPINQLITQYEEKYTAELNNINKKIDIHIKASIDQLIDEALLHQPLDQKKIVTLMTKITRADAFSNEHLDNNYNTSRDILLLIATQLSYELMNKRTPSSQALDNISALIFASENISSKSEKNLLTLKLKNTLRDLSVFQNLHVSDAMHLILNAIEPATYSSERIMLSLKRHSFITNNYHETWGNFSFEKSNLSLNKAIIIQHLIDVTLNIIRIDPRITLETSEHNEAVDLINKTKLQLLQNEKNKQSIRSIMKIFDGINKQFTLLLAKKPKLFLAANNNLKLFSKNTPAQTADERFALKKYLLLQAKESNIDSLSITFSFSSYLCTMSNEHLLNLWAASLEAFALYAESNLNNIEQLCYFVKLMTKIGNEILVRAKTDRSILNTFTLPLQKISDINDIVAESLRSQHQEWKDAKFSLFWKSISESMKILTPMIVNNEKAKSMLSTYANDKVFPQATFKFAAK